MSFDYIERTYGRRFARGQKVLALGKVGVVTGATHYVEVRIEGLKHSNNYHPSDVVPMVGEQPAADVTTAVAQRGNEDIPF
jgi:hypothetical protein